MAKGPRGGEKRSAGGSTGRGLKNGETAFASFAPTPLNPDGESIIARSADGRYRYLGNIPNYDDIRVDTESSDYKQAQRDYNVTVRFYPDGKVKVIKGGLYDRDKTYKSAEDFRKDVSKRIESRASYDKQELSSYQKGYLSQIEAEYYRGIVKKNSSAQAVKKLNEAVKGNMSTAKTRLEVADKAKRRINQVIDGGKRQIQIRFGR